jgi:hypothetical protein
MTTNGATGNRFPTAYAIHPIEEEGELIPIPPSLFGR